VGALDDRAQARLAAASAAGLRRQLPPVERLDATRYRLAGRTVVGFCSNDYLGYGAETVQIQAPRGATASRLVCGDHDLVREAEHALAAHVGAPAAVLYPSGYQANVAALSCILERNTVVYTDRLIHASLIDGIRLSRIRPTILPHRAPPPPPPRTQRAPHLYVTEAIFSMDGDRPDPNHLRAFLDAGGALYLDEAHAAGILGDGAGYAAASGLPAPLRLFTLGKALGLAGAAVLTTPPLADLLRTSSRGFVFSTGLSPLLARALLDLLPRVFGPDGHRRRARLWSNVRRLGAALGEPDPPSPIFPILLGTNDDAITAAAALLAAGFHVQPIRPPTVPPGTARLRITVTAAHAPAQIDALADALTTVLARRGQRPTVRRGDLGTSPPTP